MQIEIVADHDHMAVGSVDGRRLLNILPSLCIGNANSLINTSNICASREICSVLEIFGRRRRWTTAEACRNLGILGTHLVSLVAEVTVELVMC